MHFWKAYLSRAVHLTYCGIDAKGRKQIMIDARTAPYAALLLRVALGAMFIAHALLKYYVFTLPGTAPFFQPLGLPGAL